MTNNFYFETEEELEIQNHHEEDKALPYWVFNPNTNTVLAKCADKLAAMAVAEFYGK